MKRTIFIILTTMVLLGFSVTAFAVTNSEYEKAIKYYNSGKYSEAVKLLKEYVKKNPRPAAYYRIGYGLYKMKNNEEANEYFKEAYLIDPSFSIGLTGVPKKYPKKEMAPKVKTAPKTEAVSKSGTTPKTETAPKAGTVPKPADVKAPKK